MKMKQLAMENMEIDDIKRTKSSSRYIRKWKLAVFLARNPTIVFFRKAFLNQLHIDEIHALNDIHNDDKKSNQKRISIYTRRMSMAPLSTNSITISEPSEKRRLANLRKNDDFKI
jgi:hypothetical protein